MQKQIAIVLLIILVPLFSAGCVESESAKEIEALSKEMDSSYSSKNYIATIEYADKILQIDPKNVDALLDKAWSLRELEKYEDEIQSLKKVVEIDPSPWITGMAWDGIGDAAFNLGRYQEALNYYDLYLQKDPYSIGINKLNRQIKIRNICFKKCNTLSKMGIEEPSCSQNCIDLYPLPI